MHNLKSKSLYRTKIESFYAIVIFSSFFKTRLLKHQAIFVNVLKIIQRLFVLTFHTEIIILLYSPRNYE